MFHQVKVEPNDRDYLRFLWWQDDNIFSKPQIFRMCVNLFGAKSSPSCANSALHQTAKDNCGQYDDKICNTVLHNFYVYYFLCSVDIEINAINTIQSLSSLCATGNFLLTKWLSNSQQVLQPSLMRKDVH